MRSFFTRERIAWTVVTVVLLAAVAFFAFSPRLVAATPEEETRQYLSTLGNVFRFVRDSYVDADKAVPKALYEGALKGMFEALGDPYSEYLTADDMSGIDDTTTGVFGGVGLIITKVDKVGAEVVSPIDGTPAYRAGVSAGDMIIKVDGVETAELSSDDIVKRLRGTPDTSVAVTIRRGETIVFDVTIVRAQIEVPTVKYAMMPGFDRVPAHQPVHAPDRRARAGGDRLVQEGRLPGDGRGRAPEPRRPAVVRGAGGGPVPLGRPGGQHAQRARAQREHRVRGEGERLRHRRGHPGGGARGQGLGVGVRDPRGRAQGHRPGEALRRHHLRQGLGAAGAPARRRRLQADHGPLLHARQLHHRQGRHRAGRDVEEPKITPEQEASLGKLLQENTIRKWVAANPQPSDAKVGQFVVELHRQGIALDERTLRRLVREEVNRTNNNPPVFDLEYDIVLQAAVKAIQAGQVAPKALP